MLNKSCWALCFLSIALFGAGCGTVQPKPVVTVTVTPQSAVLTGGQTVQFTAKVTGDASGVTWAVNGTSGGNATVGTVDSTGKYAAPAATTNSTVTISAASNLDPSKTASASVTVVAPGVVAATANAQVAAYTITPPAGATVSVQFGPDTNYGLTTWKQPAAAAGGPVTILVAGMLLNNTYHMRAVLTLADNTELDDVDHAFTTGATPSVTLPPIHVITAPNAVPQSGVELLSLVSVKPAIPGVVEVTDLNGNSLWSYDPALPGLTPNPIKLLPNGHFLINYNVASTDGLNSVLREIDLSGQVVWEMTADQLNQALATATCAGCNIKVIGTHHDFALLPNGHLILIASQSKTETGLTGFPNPVNVIGDVLIDLDQNHNPVWAWSTFDHLDVNRHPMAFPDWIHANSVNYSPDDKALIVSMRHQHWVVKINYNDGQGAGDYFGSWGIRETLRCRVGQTLRIGSTLNTTLMLSAPKAVEFLTCSCSTMGTTECWIPPELPADATVPLRASAVCRLCTSTKPPKRPRYNGWKTYLQRIHFLAAQPECCSMEILSLPSVPRWLGCRLFLR